MANTSDNRATGLLGANFMSESVTDTNQAENKGGVAAPSSSRCYAELVCLLRQLPAGEEESKQAADAIKKLVAELRALIDEVERHGDYDLHFRLGAALDRAWGIVAPSA